MLVLGAVSARRSLRLVLNTIHMNNLVNIIIALLIIGWLIGYIGFGAMVGNLIHILLILAVVGIVYRLILGGKARV